MTNNGLCTCMVIHVHSPLINLSIFFPYAYPFSLVLKQFKVYNLTS